MRTYQNHAAGDAPSMFPDRQAAHNAHNVCHTRRAARRVRLKLFAQLRNRRYRSGHRLEGCDRQSGNRKHDRDEREHKRGGQQDEGGIIGSPRDRSAGWKGICAE